MCVYVHLCVHATRRSPSNFLLFCQSHREKHGTTHVKELGELWAKMSVEEKLPYDVKASELKAKYIQDKAAYEAHKLKAAQTTAAAATSAHHGLPPTTAELSSVPNHGLPQLELGTGIGLNAPPGAISVGIGHPVSTLGQPVSAGSSSSSESSGSDLNAAGAVAHGLDSDDKKKRKKKKKKKSKKRKTGHGEADMTV